MATEKSDRGRVFGLVVNWVVGLFVAAGAILIVIEYGNNVSRAFHGRAACEQALTEPAERWLHSQRVVVRSTQTRFGEHHYQVALLLRPKDFTRDTHTTLVCHFKAADMTSAFRQYLPGDRLAAFEDVTRSLLDPRFVLARNSVKRYVTPMEPAAKPMTKADSTHLDSLIAKSFGPKPR